MLPNGFGEAEVDEIFCMSTNPLAHSAGQAGGRAGGRADGQAGPLCRGFSVGICFAAALPLLWANRNTFVNVCFADMLATAHSGSSHPSPSTIHTASRWRAGRPPCISPAG